MKADKKIMLFGLATTIILIAASLMSGCIVSESKKSVLKGFEVHEWGIFEQVYGSNITQVISEPSYSPVVAKKPVIYFHYNEDLTDIVVEIDINGDILVTIPNATNTSGGIGWTVDLVNNTIIAPDGTEYEYLFYECQINMTQGVVAFIKDDGENVTFYVKNIGNYEITDVFYIYGYSIGDHFWTRGLTYVHIDNLSSGEQKTITVPKGNNSDYDLSEILNALLKNGLTESESWDLINYWKEIWFSPTNLGAFAQMFYIIPQEIYDELLPISISPMPEVMKRVGLIFVTGIPVNKPVIEEFTYEKSCSVCPDEECVNITWIDNDTLVVEACVLINCCQYIENGSADFFGEFLVLDYDIAGDDLCDCVCYRQIRYVISGLPKMDFDIEFKPYISIIMPEI